MANTKEIQSMLHELLEEEIPSAQVNLWPAVKADLVAGNRQPKQQGEKMNTRISRHLPQISVVTVLILALLALFFVTPPGRSFAQSVLELFTRAESSTFPLEESQIAPAEPDRAQPTAPPPAPLISVAEVEEQVGFNIAELPSVPAGFNYLGARLYGNHVTIEYQAQGGGGHLIIMQSQEGFYQSDWDNVPADAVIPVEIGELNGEFAQGAFVVYPEETIATWNPDAPIMRLRWVNNGISFEITKHGDTHQTEYLDLTGLLKLAESLTVQP